MPSATDRRDENMSEPHPAYITQLLHHFADLRDGTHGGAADREGKERSFEVAVPLVDPFARQVLDEINAGLLGGTGEVSATGYQPGAEGPQAVWTLTWPEQQAAAISPVTIGAYYGLANSHPHLRGATVGDWPLNVFDSVQAAAALPTLRAIASADLHNLVFLAGWPIIPAITAGWTP
jgi:hypothetical protein